MSIYKQLWLAILGSMLLALAGTLLASMLSARSYLQDQLTMKNADNAAALALSLSQQQPDLVLVELAVAALFDSGHYASIEVLDPEGFSVIRRSSRDASLSAPRWFTRLLPIEATPGTAQISNGWNQLGTVVVRSNSDFAYASLWRSALEMVAAVIAAALLGGWLGKRILARISAPLAAVVAQAQAISERRFVTTEAPRAPELRQLNSAMNSMVLRLKQMFDDEAIKLESVRKAANADPLTGLANRSHLLARVQNLLEAHSSSGGTLLLVRVMKLADINHAAGRDATDALLRSVATGLSECSATADDAVTGRLNGADFALLFVNGLDVSDLVEGLQQALRRAAAGLPGQEVRFALGSTRFRRGDALAQVLAAADNALAAAESAGGNCHRQAETTAPSALLPAGNWEQAIRGALDGGRLTLGHFPVNSLDGRLLHLDCPLRLRLDEDGEWLPGGDILPMAERLGLTPLLDLAALREGLAVLSGDATLPGIAINLHGDSLAADGFLDKLVQLLANSPAASRKRLWLEVNELAALRHLDAFRTFINCVHPLLCHVGIEHFGRRFSQVGRFHDLGIDYFKVDASFIHNLADNPGNQSFLEGLRMIARSVGVMVIAEGVAREADLEVLHHLGFDGATGPVIR